MTYTYTQLVADGGYLNLLFHYKSSVYKVLIWNLLVYNLCYVFVAILYHHILSDDSCKIFEHLVGIINASIKRLSGTLCFILGFYVNIIVRRWWQQWSNIPCPDKVAHVIQSSIVPNPKKQDDREELIEIRRIKKNLLRYISLASFLVFMKVSTPVKAKFKNKARLVEMKYMTQEENALMESCKQKSNHWNYWVPFLWYTNLVTKCESEGRVITKPQFSNCINAMNSYREELRNLVSYDWVNIPLVYTQVVTIATYCYFLLCIFGYQTLKGSEEDIKGLLFFSSSSSSSEESHDEYVFLSSIPYLNRYIPFYMMLELLFYMGLLKVAEQLINPFGDDDEDFPILEVLTRNYEVSMLIVDQNFNCTEGGMPDLVDTSSSEEEHPGLDDGAENGWNKVKKRRKKPCVPNSYKGSLYQKKNNNLLHVRLENLLHRAPDREKERLKKNKNLLDVRTRSARQSRIVVQGVTHGV